MGLYVDGHQVFRVYGSIKMDGFKIILNPIYTEVSIQQWPNKARISHQCSRLMAAGQL